MLEVTDSDPVRTYTREEEVRLSANLLDLTTKVHAGEFSKRRVSLQLFDELHHSLFVGVRGHAGRHRHRSFGSERLVFGPYRSSPRETVQAELEKLAVDIERKCDSLSGEERRVVEVYQFVAQAHARFIRIHPFEDGNGRVGRVLLSLLLVRLGLHPIAVETVKQEYLNAINAFHDTQNVEPLLDLLLRIGAAQQG